MKNFIVTCVAALAATTIGSAPAKASADPFIGEIMEAGYNFCPRGWARADGQLLPIAQYNALFSLLGTIYGGDGSTTFALPDLRTRKTIHTGNGAGIGNFLVGQKGGLLFQSLGSFNMPSHSHGATSSATSALKATDESAGTSDADGAALAASTSFATGGDLDLTLENGSVFTTVSTTVNSAGSGQSFSIQNPFLGNIHCIALEGIYPSRS